MAEYCIQPLSLLEKNIMFKKSYILFFFTTCSSTIFSNDLHPLSYHNKTSEDIKITLSLLFDGYSFPDKQITIPAKTCVRFFHSPLELNIFTAAYFHPEIPLYRKFHITSPAGTETLILPLSSYEVLTPRTLKFTHISKGEQIGCKATLE